MSGRLPPIDVHRRPAGATVSTGAQGGGVADGFAVDEAALRAAAHGIRGTVEQVASGDIAPVGAAAGHDELGRVLDDFLDRWHHGVLALTADGRAMADQLDGDARAYAAVDQVGSERLGGVLRGGGLDPAGG